MCILPVLVLCGVVASRVDAESGDLNLLILHTNDMHARFEQTSQLSGSCNSGRNCYGGFGRVAHVVNEARTKAHSGTGRKVLFLNAGDTYTGTVWYGALKWKIVADFLNILNPDAISLGNHEFDDKPEGLVPFVNQAIFPILAANLDFSQEPELASSKIVPSTVVVIEGRRIGIIGYLTPDTKTIAPTGNVIFNNELESIRKESEKLQAEGVNTIIALGHSGFATDKLIAEQAPLVDLVIGGHTNTFLFNGKQPDLEEPEGPYPVVIRQPSGKEVPVVQAYAFTKYMGRLNITVAANGSITEFSGQPLLLDKNVPEDSEALRLLEKYRPAVLELNNQVIGSTKVVLDGASKICRIEECNFGNFITDALVSYRSSVYKGKFWTDAPIAFYNGGNIRNTLSIGNITRGEFNGALPYEDRLWSLDLRGSVLLQVLEWSVHSVDGSTSRGEFLQMSGMRVSYDLGKPTGNRVVSAMARCGKCPVPIYHPVAKNATYRVMVPGWLLNGGDGYEMFKGLGTGKVMEDVSDVEIVLRHLNRTSPIYPNVEFRISFV